MFVSKKKEGATYVQLSSLSLGGGKYDFEIKHAERILKRSKGANGSDWKLSDSNYVLENDSIVKKEKKNVDDTTNKREVRKPEKQDGDSKSQKPRG